MKYLIAFFMLVPVAAYAATACHICAEVWATVTAEQAAAGASAPCVVGDGMMVCIGEVR